MDLTTVFCDIDDFCREFTLELPQELLPMPSPRCNRRSGLGLSEIMTILVMFHHSGGHRNFKGYYTQHVCRHWSGEFPGAPSYSRLIQLVPRVLWPLLHYLGTRRGEVSGVSFVDSTPLRVCHNARIHSHKVFQGLVRRGKTSVGWFFGLKLHLIISDRGDLLGIRATPGNADDRSTVPAMAQGLSGKLFGDRGYISQKLFESLRAQGVELITSSART